MPDRPLNLLFLYTDEQRADTLSAYGNERIRMPHLNALAEESVVFRRAYVSQPVCTPSRATILTGLWPHTSGCLHNNVPLRPDTRTLGERLREAGYATAHHGKWHLGDEVVAQHGFEDWAAIEDNYRAYYSRREYLERFSAYHHFLLESGFEPDREVRGGRVFSRAMAARLPERRGKPAFLARTASRFIRENRGRPFALFVNFLEPHMPFFGPYDDMYDPAEVPLPPNWNEEMGDDVPVRNRVLQEAYKRLGEGHDHTATADACRRLLARYWGLCSLVDTHAGTILRTLEECGLKDRTLIVFTSDHGDMMGDHGLIAKCVMYEEAVKVPWLIRHPALGGRQRIITEPVSQIDLAPTLLDMLDLPAEGPLEGKSLWPALRGRESLADNHVFIEWNGPDGLKRAPDSTLSEEAARRAHSSPGRAVIAPDGWKLVLYAEDVCELRNLREDPHEMTNRIHDPGQAGRIARLTERIRAWQRATGDTAPLPDLPTG